MGSTVQELTDFAVDVLEGMDGPRLPAEAVFAILCSRLDSPGAVLQYTAWRTGETEIQAHGVRSADVPPLVAATRAMRFAHPLMVATAAGDLAPETAQTAAGGPLSWRRSPARTFLCDLLGWDQIVSLPLRGSPTEVFGFAFARAARDYDEEELAFLSTVQPLLRALDRHARLIGRWQADAGCEAAQASAGAHEAHLTGRELTVLLLLAEGHTACAIAHRLGCSTRTVSKHTESLYRKLGVSDRLTAVLTAQRRGILRAVDRSPGRPLPG